MTQELTQRIVADAFLSKHEASEYLACSTKTIERFMKAGLKHYNLTNHPTFRRSDLDSFAAQFRKGAA